MKTFQEWFEANRSEEFPKGDIKGSWFVEHNIPMIVHCTCCEMTMCVVNARIDNDGHTFCGNCSEYYEEDYDEYEDIEEEDDDGDIEGTGEEVEENSYTEDSPKDVDGNYLYSYGR